MARRTANRRSVPRIRAATSVPPSTPSRTPPTPAVKSAFEMNPARQSPNTPDMTRTPGITSVLHEVGDIDTLYWLSMTQEASMTSKVLAACTWRRR